MLNFQLNTSRDGLAFITNRQIQAANNRPLARLHLRRADVGGWKVDFDFLKRQTVQLLLLGSRLTGSRGASFVLIDECLQLFLLCRNRRVGSFGADLLFFDLLQVSGDLAVIHCQLAAIQIQRV